MLQSYIDPNLGSTFIMQLSRVEITEAIHPDNGSTIEGIPMMGMMGTGWLDY